MPSRDVHVNVDYSCAESCWHWARNISVEALMRLEMRLRLMRCFHLLVSKALWKCSIFCVPRGDANSTTTSTSKMHMKELISGVVMRTTSYYSR
ncbi:hypothetical protein NDU88_000475 [Pleurodeles waltl]|uniref:Uncharacterized protein n=1 Tax=Pleurodeles waltl TaxID=8319 RepID=A0AAV7SX70_PLEWA|nr:hypothetical protein NDU88_000475 [Pleurodeles waltl]